MKIEKETSQVPQVILENSPVGESQANGRVENAIERVQGQIRAIRLDLEDCIKEKLDHDHPLWPWLIEYAGQTIHMFQVNRDDGLTASQRIRGKAAMSPQAKFGDKVLYKPMKTVKLDKSEAKWRYGAWVGTIEHTSEHIIGTPEGVIKCRAIAPIAEDKRYDAEFLGKIRGKPWKPSTLHNGWKIRTNLESVEEDEIVDEGDDFKGYVDMNEDVEEARRIVREGRRSIEKGSSVAHSFHITQADIARYQPSSGCDGCRFVTGRISCQRPHGAACRKIIMDLMKEDIEDRYRVEAWEISHGIRKEEMKERPEREPEKVNEKEERQTKKEKPKETNKRK